MGISSIAVQTLVFLQAILFGIAAGLLYDVLRAVRRQTRAGILMTALCDGVFWVMFACAFFLFVVVRANGEGRAFILIGVVLGITLYFAAFTALILPLISIVVDFVTFALKIPLRLYNWLKKFVIACGIRNRLQKGSEIVKKKLPIFHKRV